MSELPIDDIKAYFLALQDHICLQLEAEDGGGKFVEDAWQRPGGGGGRTRVITNGNVIEKGGVNFSHVDGEGLPASATNARPALAGRSLQTMEVSLKIDPSNPYVRRNKANA